MVEGDPDALGEAVEAAAVIPVYQALPNGPLLVPTGKVFARFEEGTEAAAQQASFADCGYGIDKLLSYAPHCAWLQPADGAVSSGLAGVACLMAMPGIESVEPEMLGPRVRR